MGLPLPGSPLAFLHPQLLRQSTRREGQMQPGSKLLRLLAALVIGPTSLNGGEGLLPGRRVWLEASWGGEGKGEGGGLQSRGLGGIEKRDRLRNYIRDKDENFTSAQILSWTPG
jgi:hypothetical protein